MSPGGIVNINRLNKVKLQKRIVDWAEDMVRHQAWSQERRVALRRTVDEA